MFHLDNGSGIDVMPVIKQTLSRLSKWFTEGDTQTPPSYPGADWFNIVQAELLNVLKDAGIEPNKTNLNQLSLAIQKLIEKNKINISDASVTTKGIVKLNSSTNSTSETEAATLLAVKNVNDNANNAHNRITTVNNIVALITDKFQSDNLESRMCSPNHGFYLIMRNDGVVGMYNKAQGRLPWGFSDNGVLCEGYVPASRVTDLDQFVRDRSTPVGVPLPWPQVYPPSGYFECNGSQFNKAQFPKLASAYPSGYLPDLRGEFIRGWDNARGADPYRVILSWQTDAIRNIWGGIYGTNNMSHAFIGDSVSTAGAFRVNGVGKKQAIPNEGGQTWGCEEIIFDPSIASPIGSDNHPRNVAFMYIVKAE